MPQLDRKISIECLKWLLRPVARFCLKNSILYQDIAECLKLVLLEAARDEIAARSSRVTESRMSVMTGLQRRDIGRLGSTPHQYERFLSLSARVIGQWASDPLFLTKAKKPRVLSAGFEGCEFNQLVQKISRELNPATVLFDLERINAVGREGRKVRLLFQQYTPKGDVDAVFHLLSDDLQDIIAAVSENVFEQPEISNLHCRTEYDRIRTEALPEIRNWLLRQGHVLHEQARHFISRFDQDVNPVTAYSGKLSRVVISSFSRTSD